MAKVFDNAMVAHVWAQQDQASGRSHNGNFSFEGRTLYSYSTPIGRFVDSAIGEVILVTSRTFSMTTSSKHMPALRRAIAYGRDRTVFSVPNLGAALRGGSDHESNMAHLVDAYRETAKRYARKSSDWTGISVAREYLAKAHAAVHDYGNAFGVTAPAIDVDADMAVIEAVRAKRAADAADPVKQAKCEADRLKRAERKERAEAEKRRIALMNAAEKVAAWREGAPVNLLWNARHAEDGGAMLRVRGDALETSLGATVPLTHAVRVFRFVKLCRERGEAWKRNGHTIRVGHFQVDSIEPNGDFRAGCHSIGWQEVERTAIAAGVFNESPDAAAVVESVA